MKFLKRQEEALELFSKQIQSNKVSHAYLLVGDQDTKEVAFYMAQSLFCERRNGHACQECDACRNVVEGNLADFSYLSGVETSIKKEDIVVLQHRFVQTSLERVKHKVYIIEAIDNASLVAMNSFLKFLEEPDSNIVAILTTSKPNQVLETIKSRCLTVSLNSIDRVTIYNDLQAIFEPKDALILSYLSLDKEDAQRIFDNPLYRGVVDTFEKVVNYIHEKRTKEAGICLQVLGLKEYKFNLEAMKWFCILHEYYYDKNIGTVDLNELRFILETGLYIKDRIRPGVITSLLIDQYAYVVYKEG